MEYTEQMIYYTLQITAKTFPNRKTLQLPLHHASDHQLSVNELRDLATKSCRDRGMWFEGFKITGVEIEDRTHKLEAYNPQGVRVSTVDPETARQNLLRGLTRTLTPEDLALYNGNN